MTKKPQIRRAANKSKDSAGNSEKPVPVVGIGASAGGIEAFKRFFPAVAPDSGLAFVVVLHMSRDHESRLPETIARFTRLPVKQVTKKMKIERDCVYVIPPDADLTVSEGALRCSKRAETAGSPHSIDTFLTSLAEDRGECAACVILSGTGSDGTIGLRAIKEHGGLTMAQAEASAEYDGMMTSAIGTGLVDLVLRPEEMPAKLADYFRHLDKIESRKGPDGLDADVADQLGQICAVLRARTGHDFSSYKDKTILRRVQRRMQVLQIDNATEFLAVLRKEPRQVELLFQDLLIGVTQFFRDPEAFETLARKVIPKLFEGKGANDSVRVWVPGCSTGEEAYSIAMLLREQMPKSGAVPKLQIFASDIDEQALEIARIGRYPAAIAERLSAERLRRFFLREDGTYRIVSDLREFCLFSAHDLLRNAPFSKLDLISCRNLLIYFNGDLQNRVIPLFHYALREHGYLFLGSSENVTRHAKLFDTVDKGLRIFQRRAYSSRGLPHFPLVPSETAPLRHTTEVRPLERQPTLLDRVERTMLERYSPAFVVINRDGDIMHFSGQTGSFLEHASGAPDHNVFRMARPGLRPTLRAAVHRSAITGRTAIHKDITVAVSGGTQKINLVVQPVTEGDSKDELYLVVFQSVGVFQIEADGEAAETVGDVESATMRELESELRGTRERLQATTEELEASNEELKSSNEELSSMNEELQSANEELETSKEELQSINEELHTVNAELTSRVEELSRANSDIVNLLESTQIATVFLDRDFAVKSFTPAAKDLFHLMESDAGRPLSHIRARFGADTVTEDAEKVLRTLGTIERQVISSEDDARYIMRMLPYRTVDNVISGVVVTFINVTGLTVAEAKIEELNRTLRDRLQDIETLLDFVPAGIFQIEGPRASHVRVNRHGALLLGEESEPKGLRELRGPLLLRRGGREIPPEEQPLQQAARTGQAVPSFEAELERADGGMVDVLISATPLLDDAGKAHGAIAAMVDITDRKKAEVRQGYLLHELQHRVKNILATVVSLASRLRRSHETIDGFSKSLMGRLQAMARTQELLSQRSGETVGLRDLIATAVSAHETSRRDALRMSGPDVNVPGADAATLSMIMYELATNAAKYGALSTTGGSVSISWSVDRQDGTATLALEWQERDGPKVSQPSRAGFGTTFIQRSVEYELGGASVLTFEPDGFLCHLSFPLKE